MIRRLLSQREPEVRFSTLDSDDGIYKDDPETNESAEAEWFTEQY